MPSTMPLAVKQKRYRQWVKLMTWAAREGWQLQEDAFAFTKGDDCRVLRRDGTVIFDST